MSEGDVSLIRDEDVLRRMWQQTEDFSRKKEIRAHMYRLREERLRNLYSPEPPAPAHSPGKGVEQTHVAALADQSFQRLKRKEVRDAGSPSPPRDLSRGTLPAELRELSNAGWNVESENRTTDDGHTQVRAVTANIEGRYDVEGGRGQFTALDQQRRARTEYHDDHSSLQRDESASNTAHREQVVRKTDDGTEFTSTATSSNSTSKVEQYSSTHEVPYVTNDDYNLAQDSTNRKDYTKVTKTNDYEQNLRRNEYESGELVSRKVDYPDDNTKVIVETRCLPDGTRVTSTRREFRAPVQSTRSEQHSARSESKSYSTSSHHKSDVRESTKNIREFDTRTRDIVDSQKHADDYDFKKNESDHLTQTDNYSVIQQKNQQTSNDKRLDTKESSSKIIRETVDSRSDIVDTQSNLDDYKFKRIHRPDHLVKKDDVTTNERKNTRYETKTNESDRYESTTSSDIKINKNTDHSTHEDNISTQRINRHETKVDETDRREFTTFVDDQNVPRNVKEVHNVRDSEERVHKVTRDKKVEEVLEKKTTSDQYQTTYQTDFTQKKISTDWSPTHQAWASTLRADTPSSTRPTTRASSPGSKTYQSSTSSLRSSVSPDKTTRKPTSRGGSPSKVDRYSPSRLSTERYSSTHSTHSVTENKTDRFNSPDRKPPSGQFSASPDRKVDGFQKRPSQSPEKRPQNSHRSSASPETKPGYKSSPSEEYPRTYSPSRPKARSPSRSSVSPQRKPEYQPSNGKSTPDSGYPRTTSPYRSTISPEKKVPEHPKNISQSRPSISPDRKPGHQQPSPTRTSPEKTHPFNESPKRPSVSPDRKPGYMRSTAVSTPFERPSSERKSPAKHVPSQSPEQKPYNKITQAKEDHYKFIDEETKMYTRIDREDVDVTKKTTSPSPDRYSTPHDKSPSPTKNSPEDTTDNRCESPSILRKGSRSPSPPKGPVTFTQDQVDKSKSTVTNVTTKYDYQNVINKHTSPRHETDSNDVKYDTLTRQNKTTTKVSDIPASHPKKSQRDSVSPTKYPDSPREPSPSKFGTYDKKRQTEEVKNITVTTKDSSDIYYDSTLTRQNKNTTKEYDIPASPTKKSPRDSVSPTKYPDSPREPSPSKFGTYDKKRQTDEVENRTVTTKNSSEVKYDSLTRKNKTTIKESDLPATSTKKAPGVSVSPSKCPDSPREPSPSKYKKQTNTEELEKVLTTTVEDRTDIKFDSLTRRHKTDSSRPDSPSSPVKKAPRDSVSPTKTLNTPRELSPSKYGTYDKKQYQTDEVEEVITTTKKDTTDVEYDSLKRRKQVSRPRQEPDVPSSPSKKSPRDSVSPTKTPGSIRDPSPTKYGTYDKNQYRTEELKEVTTTSTTQDTTDVKYDSLTRRQKTSSSKPDLPSSPTKKFPTESASPVKSPTKDAKYKHTADFITTETMTEEINKKSTKDRPRQLVTPSTSPTRKPKPSDTAPSSGQSSPTTSVSGFVYFGSPQTNRNIVTDLDDYEYHTETNTTTTSNIRHTRPETLNVERSPSPSKIPCKSPTSEKKVSPVKETLPRKSSLKKPPTDFNLTSPVEKPPSSFRVSPTDDRKQFPEHKIVKKDHADKPLDSPIKQKPPFERRETYEERCLKILGVIDDDTKQVTKTEKEPNSNLSSPSVSPCPSPELKEQLPFKNVDTQNTTKIQVTDFITREQEDTIKKTTTRREDMVTTDRKTMKPTRESSPTKLQDIITTSKYDKTTTEELHEDNITKTVRQSPDRDIGYRKPHEDKQSPDLKSSRTSPNRSSLSPEKTPEQPKEGTASEYPPTKSPSKPHAKDVRSRLSPERKYGYQQPTSPSIPEKGSAEKYPKQSVPTRSSVSPDRKPDYIQTTASTTTQREDTSTVKDIHIETTSTSVKQSLDRETGYQKPKDRKSDSTSVYPRPTSPDKTKKGKSPDSKPGYEAPSSVLENNLPGIKPTDKTSSRPSSSPEKPGYMKPTAATVTKFDETTIEKRDVVTSKIVEKTHPTSPQQPSSKKHEEPKHSRTPSPTKTVKKATEDISEFIMFEREQEVLDRVQQSLRKLSPNREQKSPSREKSPGKTTISLQDIDVVATETSQTDDEDDFEITENETTTRTDVTRIGKPKEQKSPTKTFSRTVSPTKKPVSTAPSKTDKNPESPNKSRSISPKKAVSPTERPRSPQVPKASGIKQREPIPSNLTRKPSSTSPTKTEKISIEVKKTTGFTKQNSFTKTSTVKTTASKFISTPNKTEPETKRAPTPKGINKENVSPKKEDTKVTRTPSDISLKIKKPSPQRMRSKPEIQVNDVSTAKTTKTTTTTTRKATKEPQTKLAPKPKSATALNTSTDEDDIIIDVELAKSSRENSPDRICPTPVNFGDDVGTPRLPDEVSEPDDDFRNRTHHTIHETESIVDDIVEICEDDELFVKRTDVDRITESDECLLSVTDKVSKFTNKIENVTKPKESTMQFKDTERRVHSDFIKEDLKSDECLLTVSEKVNKFAKGTRDSKDKSPSRRITDEYDTDTVYQDDYTKLSVNDKAHLFIETAENVKTPKSKPTQPIERPDLSNIDESLKSDDCLLSVSDKVNKFFKTTEHFLTESHEVDEKEKKVREEYEKFIKHIVEDSEEDAYESKKTVITKEVSDRKLPDEKKPSFAKETSTSHAKVKDYSSPNLKPTERIPTVKITTLRSSEAVKKAKALFENIASTTQKTKDTKTTTLMDIGVIKKSPKTDSTTVLHPSVEDSLNVTETDSEVDAPYTPTTKDRPSSGTLTRPRQPAYSEDKPRSPIRLSTQSPEVPRNKSPMRHTTATTTPKKTVLSRYPAAQTEPKQARPDINKEIPQDKTPKQPSTNDTKQLHPESEKPQEKIPSYQRPTKTSQIKEEKTIEEAEVSSRRGSGKFGVELRRTSVERSTLSSERRRSSDHHQPCIEDIFDLDLLEQMLEKVVGYEQRRRIRSQIRVAKKRMETEHYESNNYLKTTKQTIKSRSPEPRHFHKYPETQKPPTNTHEGHSRFTPQKSTPSVHTQPKEQSKPLLNGHAKEPSNLSEKRQRPQSPEKPKSVPIKTRSPVRRPSPEKKTRTTSPTKTTPKPKSNRFSEYATAYMKKVGLEADKLKVSDKTRKDSDDVDHKTERTTTKKTTDIDDQVTVNRFETKTEIKSSTMSKSFSGRTSSKDTIEIVQLNGKRSPSPEKRRSPERRVQSPGERLHQRTPSPDFKRRTDKETIVKNVYETNQPGRVKETIIKTVYEERPRVETTRQETTVTTAYDIETKIQPKTAYVLEKKVQPKTAQEDKPSWVTNRNLKKPNEPRTFPTKRAEDRARPARPGSPARTLARPTDVITSSYGPGPLDADGRPLFGIKALRNGASNYQVKGTVVRQEFHSRNGGEPEGSVSVTAYSTEPQDLERLLQAQGERPSRIHGLAAITTTKRFGGDSGASIRDAQTREERAALEQFTHSDRRVEDSLQVTEVTGVDDALVDSRTIEDRSMRTDDRSVRADERGVRNEDRRERVDRREDKKTVRQSSVKSLTEKYIKSASDTLKSERCVYPKAGLILRTANMRDSVSSDSSAHAGLARTDSEHSLGSVEEHAAVTTRVVDGHRATATATTTRHTPDSRRTTVTTTRHAPDSHRTTTVTTTRHAPETHRTVTTRNAPDGQRTVTTRTTATTERSFLDSNSKVTGVQDILTRMKNADIVVQEGDSSEDAEARALLNKFLGATVLMAGMQGYVADQPGGGSVLKQETVRSSGVTSARAEQIDPEHCWDERVLRKLLDECTDYEQRRRLRARLRTLMAEQEACASAVTEALAAAGEAPEPAEATDAREEEEVTVSSSVRRNSSEKTVSSSTITRTSKVIESATRPAPKPVSPFAKFRQLEKQNSTNSPNSPKTPQSPGSQPYFKFTDPALQASALTIKERLLQWCRDKTRDYENVKLENFSTSWADGLAFCALLHHFLPDAFDYSQLTADKRRHNFTLAFKIADEKAGIYPLLDVDDMVTMRRPDWKCVFTYVQAIHRRFKDQS